MAGFGAAAGASAGTFISGLATAGAAGAGTGAGVAGLAAAGAGVTVMGVEVVAAPGVTLIGALVTGAVGVTEIGAGVAPGAAGAAVAGKSFTSLRLCCLAVRTESVSVSKNRPIASQTVNFCRTVVVCAPNI